MTRKKLSSQMHDQIAEIYNAGMRLHTFCLKQECRAHARLEFDELIGQLDRQGRGLQVGAAPKLACGRCGSVELAVMLSAEDGMQDRSRAHLLGTWPDKDSSHH